MKLVVVGKNSFLAQHIIAVAQAERLDVTAIRHDEAGLDAFAGADWVVNCAKPPDDTSADFDGKIAALAAKAGTGVTMLSSRRVYAPETRWGAREDTPALGDDTLYGAGKARSEAAVRGSGARHAIFRLSNVFGSEHGRATFMGRLLTCLKARCEIHFDMSPATRRDFIPVECAVTTILRQVKQGIEGTFNLGSGFALPCGDIAAWVMEGYGGGRLVVSEDGIRDEFFLDMDKTAAALGARVTPDEIRRRCAQLGESLRG